MLIPFLLIATASATSDVLFVGNSYTTSNNLNDAVAAVFAAAGEDVHTGRVASGGLTLAAHAARAADPSSDWYTKLVTEAADREWVVLQDQSQTPGFPEHESAWMASRDGAVALNELVVDADAQTLFFLTWGYVDGDPRNAWLYPDYTAMQGHLTHGYIAYAEACATADRPVWVAPVGPAYGYIHDQLVARGEDPLADGALFADLYSGDGSHPARLGTQLAAYVFYASISGETPVGLEPPSGLDAARVLELQEAAAAVVFDTSDDFIFPWEDTVDPEDSGTAPTDTGSEEPSSDTGSEEPSSDTGSEEPPAEEEGGDDDESPSEPTEASTDGPGPGDYPATLDDDDDKKSGCSHAATSTSPFGWMLLLSILLLRRRAERSVSTL
jgi:hypothetical protein